MCRSVSVFSVVEGRFNSMRFQLAFDRILRPAWMTVGSFSVGLQNITPGGKLDWEIIRAIKREIRSVGQASFGDALRNYLIATCRPDPPLNRWVEERKAGLIDA